MKKGVHVIFYIIVILAVVVVLSFIIKPQEDVAKVTTTTTVAKLEKCGNEICDTGERFDCCRDCVCPDGQECMANGACETEFLLTKEDVENAVRRYLGTGDYTLSVSSVADYQGKKAMLVYVYTPDTMLFAVDENNVVTEIELDEE